MEAYPDKQERDRDLSYSHAECWIKHAESIVRAAARVVGEPGGGREVRAGSRVRGVVLRVQRRQGFGEMRPPGDDVGQERRGARLAPGVLTDPPADGGQRARENTTRSSPGPSWSTCTGGATRSKPIRVWKAMEPVFTGDVMARTRVQPRPRSSAKVRS